MLKITLAVVAALAMLATVVPVQAGSNCHTTCTTIGNQQHCNTFCY